MMIKTVSKNTWKKWRVEWIDSKEQDFGSCLLNFTIPLSFTKDPFCFNDECSDIPKISQSFPLTLHSNNGSNSYCTVKILTFPRPCDPLEPPCFHAYYVLPCSSLSRHLPLLNTLFCMTPMILCSLWKNHPWLYEAFYLSMSWMLQQNSQLSFDPPYITI